MLDFDSFRDCIVIFPALNERKIQHLANLMNA